MFNGCVVREGNPVTIGENSIVMENAVLRITDKHELVIGNHCLFGPHALLSAAGLTILSSSTGAAVFHGACLRTKTEVLVQGVVRLRTEPPPEKVVPIGWVEFGPRPSSRLPKNTRRSGLCGSHWTLPDSGAVSAEGPEKITCPR